MGDIAKANITVPIKEKFESLALGSRDLLSVKCKNGRLRDGANQVKLVLAYKKRRVLCRCGINAKVTLVKQACINWKEDIDGNKGLGKQMEDTILAIREDSKALVTIDEKEYPYRHYIIRNVDSRCSRHITGNKAYLAEYGHPVTDQAKQIKHLKAQIKKLQKKAKPVITTIKPG
ncbi:hypothetical protein Tco_0304494 [Tanacetum coccineum]